MPFSFSVAKPGHYIMLLLLLASFPASSQKIEKYFNYAWKETSPENARFYGLIQKTDSGWSRKDYFLTINKLQMAGTFEDSDCKIQTGIFHYFYSNGLLEQTGHYMHGKKYGLWLRYHPNGMMADSTIYENGNPVGVSLSWHSNGYMADSSKWEANGNGVKITWYDSGDMSSAGYYTEWVKPKGKWKYFYRTGVISATEIYADGKLASKECFDENGSKMKTCLQDTTAIFPGGMKAWTGFLEKKLYFPPGYTFKNAEAATLVIKYIVDEEGNVTEPSVHVPLFPEFDKIALDIIKKSPKWIPAIRHNRKVKSYFSQPFTFTQTSY